MQFYSLCQQVNDWILLRITEKINRENVLNKEKESGVTFNPSWVKRLTAFEQLGPEVLKFNT